MRTNKTRLKVLSVLSKRIANGSELANLIDANPKTVAANTRQLVKEGLVMVVDQNSTYLNIYSITEQGKSRLEILIKESLKKQNKKKIKLENAKKSQEALQRYRMEREIEELGRFGSMLYQLTRK